MLINNAFLKHQIDYSQIVKILTNVIVCVSHLVQEGKSPSILFKRYFVNKPVSMEILDTKNKSISKAVIFSPDWYSSVVWASVPQN